MGYARPSAEVLAITERAAKAFEGFGCTVELVESVFAEDPADIWTSDFYGGIRARFSRHYRESRDALDGLHANTQIPKVVGLQRLHELTGKPEYGAYARATTSVALSRNNFQSISAVMSSSPDRF